MTDGVMSFHLELYSYLDNFKDSSFYNEKSHSYLRALVTEDNKRVFRRNKFPTRNTRPKFPPYRGELTIEELVYFSSPLNREIFLRSFTSSSPPDEGFASIPEGLVRRERPVTSKDQSCCNLDLVTLKEDKRRMQIIESKHSCEAPPSEGQKKILYRLASVLNFCNLHSRGAMNDWGFEFYLITGDEPYKEGARILNLLSPIQHRDTRFANEEELFDLLSFRIRFDQISKKKEEPQGLL